MGKLVENELTNTLLELFADFDDGRLLGEFLRRVDINVPEGELADAKFDKLSFLGKHSSVDFDRREIDGIIELPSALIYIEAKRAPAKLQKRQLLDEFRLGQEKCSDNQRFFLLAIDESVTEPAVIETIRRSSYAKIRQEQIKWISWPQVTDLLEQFKSKNSFEHKKLERIFENRLNKFRSQGFAGFSGFEKSDLTVLRRTQPLIKALDRVSDEIRLFVRDLRPKLKDAGIARLYRVTNYKRKGAKGRRAAQRLTPYLDWTFISAGLEHKSSNVAASYIFKFGDSDWRYDLRKQEVHYYLHLEFDLGKSSVAVGYCIRGQRFLRNAVKASGQLFERLTEKQYRYSHRAPLTLRYFMPGLRTELVSPVAEVTSEDFSEVSKAQWISIEYQHPMAGKDLLVKCQDGLLALRKLVNTAKFIPAQKLDRDAESFQVDAPVEDEEG